MLKKDGSRAHKIRHIRCFEDTVTDPIGFKEQTHKSNKEYKNLYWAITARLRGGTTQTNTRAHGRTQRSQVKLNSHRVIKGDNTRGRYDLFCYAFVTMRGNESFGIDVIKRLSERYPNWKMNVKYDLDRKRLPMNKMYPNPNMSYQRPPPNMQYPNYPPMQRQPFQNYGSQHAPGNGHNSSS